jgi:hypothetical protein
MIIMMGATLTLDLQSIGFGGEVWGFTLKKGFGLRNTFGNLLLVCLFMGGVSFQVLLLL